MNRKLHLSILYVILLSLLIGSAILFSKPSERRESRSVLNDQKNGIDQSANADFNQHTKKEAINVINNHPDIGAYAELNEDIHGQVSLKLRYKLEGNTIINSLDTKDITELRNIFEFRDEYKDGYRVKDMTLNRALKKLYFKVERRKTDNYYNTSVYSYDLHHSKLNKIYYDVASFGKFFISPDGKYNAFSYKYNSNITTAIITCSNDNITLIEQPEKDSSLYSFSYDFIKWKGENLCELKEKVEVKDGSQSIIEKTAYYDIVTNKWSY